MVSTAINILLVEDSPTDASILQAAFDGLSRHSCIQIATDGLQALNILKRASADRAELQPNLILLDLNLPGKSGHEVLSDIKGSDRWKATPTIILSSSSTPTDVNSSYELHANAYITKPRTLNGYEQVAQRIHNFWLETVNLPAHS